MIQIWPIAMTFLSTHSGSVHSIYFTETIQLPTFGSNINGMIRYEFFHEHYMDVYKQEDSIVVRKQFSKRNRNREHETRIPKTNQKEKKREAKEHTTIYIYLHSDGIQ